MFELRSYRDQDADTINTLAVSCFSQFKEQFNDWQSFEKGLLSFSILSKTSDIIIAETAESTIIGAVAYVPPSVEKADYFPINTPVIRMLVVSPEHRGLGLGKALTLECIKRAQRDNCNTIALHTSTIMEVALPMYLRMGFNHYGPAPEVFDVKYDVYEKMI